MHPDVLATEFLDEHARSVLSFYFPACIDSQSGGYHQYFGPDGEPDRANKQRHLVSSTRLAINFATAARHYGDQDFLAAARHGIAFLRDRHLNRNTGGYAWMIGDDGVIDGDNQSYGIAFVLMAYARAFEAGATEAYAHIGETFDFLERHFWEEQHCLYADTLSADLSRLSPYRGQNANMHCCEAMIAAFEATGERRYLERAARVASQLTVVLTAGTGGRIWEHYDQNWSHDFSYNKGDATNKLRPWGYQPGHFAEWAKLLLTIDRHEPQAWLVSRARELFDHAMRIGYDSRYGGLYYSVAPDGTVCSDGKYSWVQAETIAAAAFLADSLDDGLYWCIYRQLWSYVLDNMVDRPMKYWHRNLTRDNVTHIDTVAMGRTDYHSICACIDISKVLARRSQPPVLKASMVSLSPTIFKAYDIRGVLDSTLDAGIARLIGRSFGRAALAKGERQVVIGRDGRLSGPALAAALADGLRSVGVGVIDLGMVATPMVYFGTHVLDATSGIMVTGSHNPPDYNGFKMVLAGEAIHGPAIASLYHSCAADDGASAAARGSYRSDDIGAAYRRRIAGDVKLARPIRIAIDCGNGVAGAYAGGLFRAMGAEVIELFCEVDGAFPNHHPDPADPANLQDLIGCLRETDAEIGLAFDGDGDRLGIVTKDGQIIYPDRQMMLFAADVLSRNPGAQILHDVKCTRHLGPWIIEHGGRPLMCKTGHSLVKARLRETGAPLGGEMSGHMFFKDRWFGFDDGMYAGARMLEILTRAADPSALLNALPQSDSTPELHLAMGEGEAHALVERLHAEADFPGSDQVITIDGVRVEYPDGFGLARASNTTPVVVLRFEAETPQGLQRIQSEFRRVITAIRPDAVLPF